MNVFPGLRSIALLAGSLLLAPIGRGDSPADNAGLIGAPAHNWVLPLFTPEGFRSILLRGDEAHVQRDSGRVDVQDINVTLFSGDGTNRWTTIILSPEASYFPRTSTVSGPSLVRVLRNGDDSELSGSDWTYQFARRGTGARETLVIRHDARVVLQSQINDFLQ